MAVPDFGLGTYRLKGQVVKESVRHALELGYRAIDTAQIYGNEADIGSAVVPSGVPRNELYLTTKIWVSNFPRARLLPSLRDSIAKLRVRHVDLTLIHWPSPGEEVPMGEYLGELLAAKVAGLTHEIGVSNFTIKQLREAIGIVGAGNIATNQVELHPYLQNRKLAEFARKEGIRLTSYMTLAYGEVLKDRTLLAIAEKHNATTAQVALAWALQLGHAVIPSSTKRANIESNRKAQTLRLSEQDMAQIAALDRGERLIDPPGLAPRWD